MNSNLPIKKYFLFLLIFGQISIASLIWKEFNSVQNLNQILTSFFNFTAFFTLGFWIFNTIEFFEVCENYSILKKYFITILPILFFSLTLSDFDSAESIRTYLKLTIEIIVYYTTGYFAFFIINKKNNGTN